MGSASDLPIAVFYRSIPKTIAILLLWLLLTALGAGVVLGCIVNFAASDRNAADHVELAFLLLMYGLPLVLSFGSILFICLAKIVRVPHGPIIEVSHAGIRDRRISPDIIPWAGIESMWRPIWGQRQAKQLLLILDAAVDNGLQRSRLSAWARRRRIKRYLIDRWSGHDDPYGPQYGKVYGDVTITMFELVGSVEDLVRAVEQGGPGVYRGYQQLGDTI